LKTKTTNEDYEYDQDSDNRSIDIVPRETKKKSEEYANILDYFEAPVWKEGNKPNTVMNYKGQAKCTPYFYYMHSNILEWESVHSKKME
jgi:hypothetical protein